MVSTHHYDVESASDVDALPWVRLLTLCGEAAGQEFHYCLRIYAQKSVHQDIKGGEVMMLLKSFLQVIALFLQIRHMNTLLQILL